MYVLSDMKLQGYLEQLLGNKTAIALSRALLSHRGKVFTVRGLADTAGVSPSETSVIVKNLEEAGVIKLQPVGRSFLVTLNEKSFLLQKILTPVIKAEKETLSELTKLLKRCFYRREGIDSVYLFGSVAKGEERRDSDVDLLVISDDFERASEVISQAREEVADVFNKQLSPLIFSKRELATKKKVNDELIQSIIENHILITGKDLVGVKNIE